MFDFGEFLLLFVIAIAANALSAFAGGGSGLLQLPLLIFLGLPFSTALATHKIATVALGIGSSSRYWKERLLDMRFSLFILACGLPGVLLGARLILNSNENLATLLLGLLTLGLGIYSFSQKNLGTTHHPKHHSPWGYAVGGTVIFVIGVTNGSLSSGTGLFATLWLIYWFGLDYQRAVATTLITVGFFWNASGAIILASLGEVQWRWLPPLIIGSLIGGYLGANLGIASGNRWVKKVFELLTMVTGIVLIAKALLD